VIRLGRGRAKVGLEVTPGRLAPTESVTAVVGVDEPVDRVRSARVQLGYVNTYDYRWAGRRDSMTRQADLAVDPTADAGTERSTEDWVGVLAEELASSDGTIAAGSQEFVLRIPSWAPGSSKSIVRWVVRVSVDREGQRDVELEEGLSVVALPPAEPPQDLTIERLMGHSSDIVVETERTWYRAGEQMRGTVTLTPHTEVPEADLAVFLQRDRASHPVERTPGNGNTLDGTRIQLDKHLTLPAGVPTTVPFEIDIPADADPTSEAVHSSLTWFVQARVLYKGFSSHGPERVRREFVMCSPE
jgi:hypothetical protein